MRIENVINIVDTDEGMFIWTDNAVIPVYGGNIVIIDASTVEIQ